METESIVRGPFRVRAKSVQGPICTGPFGLRLVSDQNIQNPNIKISKIFNSCSRRPPAGHCQTEWQGLAALAQPGGPTLRAQYQKNPIAIKKKMITIK